MTDTQAPYNVLAQRYASPAMVVIWDERSKIRLERELWIAAMKAQASLGVPIPENAIALYERSLDTIDLDSIAIRERKSRHDVKARIDEFNELAGYECIHRGFTSRDLTDNVEQLQIKEALDHVHQRTIALLDRLAKKAVQFETLDVCGRTHNIPGQTTTLGKRFAGIAEELLRAFIRLEYLLALYPLRGMKGAMGTQQDMKDVLDHEDPSTATERVHAFEGKLKRELGFTHLLTSTGQVYPRSLDYLVVSQLYLLAAPLANFALMIRLMAGHELLHEGFGKEQAGSSAMPHKMNSRTCERIGGFRSIIRGYLSMVEDLAGNQWYEGDVSCSVVRRVALPDAFFAFDGMCESALTVLDEMEVFPRMIEKELHHYLPFLSTTRILMAAVKKGVGREIAHSAIKHHAIAAIRAIRSQGDENPFVEALASDPAIPLSRDELIELVKVPEHGLAQEHVREVCMQIEKVVHQYPHACAYKPAPIL